MERVARACSVIVGSKAAMPTLDRGRALINGLLGSWPRGLQSAVRHAAVTREPRNSESGKDVAATISLRNPQCIIS
jgi:hypothetical protein